MMNQRLYFKFFLALSVLALLLGGCASGAAPPQRADTSGAPSAPEAAPREASSASGNSFQTSQADDVERLVIKNAEITLVVDDPGKSMDAIGQMAEGMGGYVVSENLTQMRLDSGVEVPRASITVRVPAERLNEAISAIEQQSSRPPQRRNVQSQDVTKDYTDQQSRLRNLENTEAQLTKIMDSATKTEDVLAVYNQLSQVREQIEVTKGQIQYYEQSAALSAIDVELLANEAVQPVTIGGWQPVGVAKDAVQFLINAVKFLANAAIWILIAVIPVGLILYVIFFLPLRLVWRALQRRRRRGVPRSSPPGAAPPAPAEEIKP